MKLLLLLLSGLLSSSPLAQCIKSEGTKLERQGIVFKASFPGAPNYESVESGDKLETYWFVKFNQPVCVQDLDLDSVVEFQLLFQSAKKASSLALVEGAPYKISGVTFMGVSGHHRTPVLIEVTNIVNL